MEGIRLRERKAGCSLRSQAVGTRGSEVEATSQVNQDRREQSRGRDRNDSSSPGVERMVGIEEFSPGYGSLRICSSNPRPLLSWAPVCGVRGAC